MFQFDDERLAKDSPAMREPWEKRNMSEEEYNSLLDERLFAERSAILKELRSVVIRLGEKRQFPLIRWLVWQFSLDWNSYDLSNSMHACQLYLVGEERQAIQIIQGIIGQQQNDNNSSHITPFHSLPKTGGVEYHGKMSLEMTEAFNKQLLAAIGSGRK